MRIAATALAMFGCFSKPDAPATPIDSPPVDSPLDVADAVDAVDACMASTSATGLMSTTSNPPTVTWPGGMQLRFGNVNNVIPMPDFLSLSGQNILALPQPAQCGTEDQAGVAVYPAFAVSTSSLSSGYTLKALDRDVIGPAYSQYTVHWARSYTCGTVTSSASGNTIFSLFPDGRIVRNDTITPSNQTSPVPIDDSCDCTPGMMAQGFLVTAYLALQRERFSFFAIGGGAEMPVPGPISDLYDQSGACAVEMGGTPGRIAVAWDTPVTAPARTRLRSVGTSGPMAELVFVYDFVSGPNLTNATRGGRTTMVMSRDTTRTCTDLHAAASAGWPPISIGPAGLALGIVNSSERRLHVDPTQYAGPITIRATNGDVPPGLVVHVRLPGTGITTSRTDGVIWQREQDGSWYIWFRDGIPSGQEITVTPECG